MKSKLYPYLLPFRSVIFFLIFVIGASIVNRDISDISNWWSVSATVVNIVTILLTVKAAHRNNSTYRELINYQKGKTTVGRIAAVSAVILLVGMSGMFLAGLLCYRKLPYTAPMMIAPIPVVLAVINLPLLPVTTALAEDGLYLGCGVNHIGNKTAAIVIPAFFFALQHSFIPTLFDVRYMIYRFISFLPLTVILCIDYHKKRDPLPIMAGHALIDAATAVQILATSAVPGLYDKMCGN